MDSHDQIQEEGNEPFRRQSRVEKVKEYISANLASELEVITYT